MFLARRSGLTIGSRWVRGGSSPGTGAARALASRAASVLVRHSTGLRRVRDTTTSFWVVDPAVARTVLEDGLAIEGYGFYPAFVTLAQAYGYSVDEVPIVYRPRYSGVATLSLRDVTDFRRSLVDVRSRAQEVRSKMLADQATWASRSGRMIGQQAASGSSFGADVELERLAAADRFFGWIADEIAPHLGRRDPRGRRRHRHGVDRPAPAASGRRDHGHRAGRQPVRRARGAGQGGTARDAAPADVGRPPDVDGAAAFDSVVYVNVLEHIRDDVGELRTAHELLVPGGTLAVFVPALPRLYGSLDFKSGHHRRYRRDELEATIAAAGFELIDVRYLDVLGVAPYYAMYRLLDVKSLGTVSSTGYDRVVVPLSRGVQRLVPHPPLGKNLLAIARSASRRFGRWRFERQVAGGARRRRRRRPGRRGPRTGRRR